MEMRKHIKEIFKAGIASADAYTLMKNHLNSEWAVPELAFRGEGTSRIFVIGAGKASCQMAKALEELLGQRIHDGLVITKYGHGMALRKIRVMEASHPVPDENGLAAASEVSALLENLKQTDIIICLFSGGASALLPSPQKGITLEEKIKVTQLLLCAGADIHEINTIRKHISQLKGGRLATRAYPAGVFAYFISDVVDDRFESIASGPTSGDPTTFHDCLNIVEKYGIRGKIPQEIMNFLEAGALGLNEETVKPGAEELANVKNVIIANNMSAIRGAKHRAEELGYNTLILSSAIEGDTREAALFHAAVVKEVLRSGNPLTLPACIISGGETTVAVKGKGSGGRNQEFVLAFLLKMPHVQGITVLSAGTDGTDGQTDAAGALGDLATLVKAGHLDLIPEDFLENNDSYNFFSKTCDLLITGHTGTNVMDLRIILIQGGEVIKNTIN